MRTHQPVNHGIANQRWAEKSPLINRVPVVGARRVGRHRLAVADAASRSRRGHEERDREVHEDIRARSEKARHRYFWKIAA